MKCLGFVNNLGHYSHTRESGKSTFWILIIFPMYYNSMINVSDMYIYIYSIYFFVLSFTIVSSVQQRLICCSSWSLSICSFVDQEPYGAGRHLADRNRWTVELTQRFCCTFPMPKCYEFAMDAPAEVDCAWSCWMVHSFSTTAFGPLTQCWNAPAWSSH